MNASQSVITRTEPLDDGVLVAVAGEVDLSRSPDLRVGLLQAATKSPARLVIDMTDVSYMDSSGVATLVEALQAQRKHHGRMILFGLQPKVRHIFEIARLDLVFTIVSDADTAKTT